MTYCAAVHDGETIYMLADSAETHRVGRPKRAESMFREIQTLDTGEIVEEKALKIAPINRRLLVTFSGRVTTILDVLAWLRMNSGLPAPEDLLQAFLRRDTHPEPGTVVLIAASLADGLRLYRWDSGRPTALEEVPRGSFADAGTLKAHEGFRAQAHDRLTMVARMGVPPTVKLVLYSALFQSLGVRNYLPAVGVGGAFLACAIDARGIGWVPDLMHFPISSAELGRKLKSAHQICEMTSPEVVNSAQPVTVFVRDDAVFLVRQVRDEASGAMTLRSKLIANVDTVEGDTTLSRQEAFDAMVAQWSSRWKVRLLRAFLEREVSFYNLLDADADNLVICQRSGDQTGQMMGFRPSEDGSEIVTMYLRRELGAGLFRPLVPGQIGLRLALHGPGLSNDLVHHGTRVLDTSDAGAV